MFSVVSLKVIRLPSCDFTPSALANFQPSGKRSEGANVMRREKYPAG